MQTAVELHGFRRYLHLYLKVSRNAAAWRIGAAKLYVESKSQVGPSPAIHEHAHVDELVGEQGVVLVIEHGFQFRGAGCRVNLIVYSR